jgi:hypothetical protein
MTAALTQTLVEGVARELDGAPLIHGRQEREERLRRIIAIGRRGQLPQ